MCTTTTSFTLPPVNHFWRHGAVQARTSPRRRPRRPRIIASAKQTKTATRFVDTPDGAKLCVKVFEPPDSTASSHENGTRDAEFENTTPRTVLLLHDFMTDRRLFDRLLDEQQLTQTRSTILAPDLRGYGCSSLPSGTYSRSDDLATIVRTLVSHEARVDVVGSGMGGVAALELALAWPTIVRSVCVVGSGLPGHTWSSDELFVDVTAAQLAGRFFQIIEIEAGDDKKRRAEMTSAMHASVSHEDADPVTWKRQFIAVNATWSDIVRKGNKSVARGLLAMARDYSAFHFFHDDPILPRAYDDEPLKTRLKNVPCPVLVLIGDKDTADFTKIAHEIYSLVPKVSGEVITIQDCGHFAVAEQPRVVVEHLLQFWQKLDSLEAENNVNSDRSHVNSESDTIKLC